MERLMVTINEDPACLASVDAAIRLAGAFGCLVDLVSVVEAGHSESTNQNLYAARARLADHGLEPFLVRLEGRVAAQLARHTSQYDLVIMRNRATLDEALHGRSVSPVVTGVLHATQTPVLVVTETTTDMSNPLLAYNGSSQSRRTITSFLRLCAPGLVQRGTVVVVTSDPHMAERLFQDIDVIAQDRGIDMGYEWTPGVPFDRIMERLSVGRHDLLVMGSFGRSWLREQIMGSTTRRVLEGCPVPIWMGQ